MGDGPRGRVLAPGVYFAQAASCCTQASPNLRPSNVLRGQSIGTSNHVACLNATPLFCQYIAWNLCQPQHVRKHSKATSPSSTQSACCQPHLQGKSDSLSLFDHMAPYGHELVHNTHLHPEYMQPSLKLARPTVQPPQPCTS